MAASKMAALVKALFLMSIAASGGAVLFEPRNRAQFRGINGEYIEMPCMVHNTRGAEVSWTHNGEVLSAHSTTLTTDERIKLRLDAHSNTWMLTIRPLQPSDAGEYVCSVDLGGGEVRSKTFTLQILQPGPDILWRPDNVCGRGSRLEGNLSHVHGECDGEGAFHCCSRWGWCGFTRGHCNCYGCIDYSKIGHRRCKGAWEEVPGSDLCFGFGPELMGLQEAENFCSGIGGSLLVHESFAELTDHVNSAISARGSRRWNSFWLQMGDQEEPSPTETFALASFLSIFGLDDTLTELESCVSLTFHEGTLETDCADMHFPLCVKPADEEPTLPPVAPETTTAPETAAPVVVEATTELVEEEVDHEMTLAELMNAL